MNERKETVFLAFVAFVLAAGVGFELVSSDVEPRAAAPVEGERFTSRALFCPPAVGGPETTTLITAAGDPGEIATVAVPPDRPEPVDVVQGGVITAEGKNGNPVQVVGYGTELAGSTVTVGSRPSDGSGAANCSVSASSRWYFSAGSASIDADERILVYNPFPDEAVVRLALMAPGGERTNTSLSDVAIPANEWRTISINEVIQVKKQIAVEVIAKRGRVVAWREMFLAGRGVPTGIDYSLGAPEPAERWYFADGAIGADVTETISVLNPGNEEATINVMIATSDETLTPPDLVEFPVPPRSQQVIDLEAYVKAPKEGTEAVSATVAVADGPGVVVERTTVWDGEEISGTSAEIGATVTSTSWFVGPASANPVSDFVAIFNPSGSDATVDITLLTKKGPETPPDLQGLSVPAGSRVKVPIGSVVGGKPVAVHVGSDTEVVAERFAVSAQPQDVSALMGYPFP